MTSVSQVPPLVTIFGGSGFLGRHLVQALARRGYRIRVACRNPNTAHHLQPLGNVGQIQAVQANLRARWSVDRAVEGADHVVNLVGILYESGRQNFDAVQDFGARAVAEAARAANAKLIHVSAIGADAESPAIYARTKARGEAAVRETVHDAVIFRPSIVFGPEDGFFNRFAAMARFSPALPLSGGGQTKFQPVYVGDVAEAIARAIDGKAEAGQTYELGGPAKLTFRQCMDAMLRVIERKRVLMPLPWWAARIMGRVLGVLPRPLLTADQVELLRPHNVVPAGAAPPAPTLEGLGIEAQSIEAILPAYLWQYRVTGQYPRPSARVN